ncbi:ThuA domain-containing protein [Polaribacter sp. Z014]|nr:ThuA domain-containing protein [Polaribacter sp. Z014]MCL7762493.1 ThuA domain-containing protein [Polaribacter sp. Z014]
MKKPIIKTTLLTIFFFSLIISCKVKKQYNTFSKKTENTILIFSKTNGYRHKSITEGITAIKKLGQENGWKTDTTEDSLQFNYQNLKKYKTLVFLNTTGNVLNNQQEKDFEKYINEGGGFVGIHAATDTEYDWPFYEQMIGAQFKSHPKQQKATLKVNKESNHAAIAHYNDTFEVFDEWYNFKKPAAKHVNVLLELDETSYSGKRMGTKHAISWYHHFQGGRIFYTGMGHTKEAYTNTDFLQHLKEGILWTIKEKNVAIDKNGEDLLDSNLSKWDVWIGAVHPSVDINFEKSKDVTKGKPMGLNNDP